MTTSVAIALLGAGAFVAIAALRVMTRRAGVALRAGELKLAESLKLVGTMEADRRLVDQVTHDLNDLLTAIVGHIELSIAGLDPAGTGVEDAREARRSALSAARLTMALGALGGGTRPANVPDGVLAEALPTARVLIVEDEPALRDLMKAVLMRAGHDVVTVAGPRGALAELTRQPAISLMLVDIVMPDMDGYELVAEARKISPGIHVVFTSAFAPDPARLPSGDAFLAKPFTHESLARIVEQGLSR